MKTHALQSAILEAIAFQLTNDTPLVEALMACLFISKDSAYRRIRGDTLFDISEIEKLTAHYNLSLNSIFGLDKNAISFITKVTDKQDFSLTDYLQSIEKNLQIIRQLPQKHLYYSARDIPIFHYFQLTDLCHFKLFFWQKYYLHSAQLKQASYMPGQKKPGFTCPEKLIGQIWYAYMKIPSTEIWTYETANITLRQIEFAYQTATINLTTCRHLLQQYQQLINHIKAQAGQGNKFQIDSDATLEGAEYHLYFNEVAIGDNSILFDMNSRKLAFITYGNLNYMSTANAGYTDYLKTHFQDTIKNSTLISTTSQKQRSAFFHLIQQKIDQVNQRLDSPATLY